MTESQVTLPCGARLNVDDDTLKGSYAETLRAYKTIAYSTSIEGTSARRVAIALRSISFFTRIAYGAHGLMSINELACFICISLFRELTYVPLLWTKNYIVFRFC